MPVQLTYPGVYVKEVSSGVRPIPGVPTSIAAFIGRAGLGPVNEPKLINSYTDFETIFGGINLDSRMSYAVQDFFRNGGGQAVVVRLFHEEPGSGTVSAGADEASFGELLTDDDYIGVGKEAAREGLFALEKTDIFNLLCLPPEGATADYPPGLVTAAATYCEKRRALLLLDSPSNWTDKGKAVAGITAGVGTTSANAALFFPRIKQPNPLRKNRIEEFVSSGAVAGIFSRTDARRGVWKAPAGVSATLRGVSELSVKLTDSDNDELNPLGVNCLRTFPGKGSVVWGARTLKGVDRLASEWKYISVRRVALFIEESLYRGTRWVVFEPNDEQLWARIRLSVNAFMQDLFRQGAFQGSAQREAYFVKCDRETITKDDIRRGIVNISVGFAPLRPAEFVVIRIQQIAGGT